jgi:hypothetical protein
MDLLLEFAESVFVAAPGPAKTSVAATRLC